jgi:hypothetical protein
MTDQRKNPDLNLALELGTFLRLCRDAALAWGGIDGHIQACENRTQDFLHALELGAELGDAGYADRARKERENRQERRALKNEKGLLLPLMSYLESPAGKAAVSALEKVLGDIRREEKRQATCSYRPRASENQKTEGNWP